LLKKDEEWIESDWIVREAMRFVDVPYSQDLHLKEAFRHPIGFPDDVFPDAWKGVYLSILPEEDLAEVNSE
jgi:hypothetical protein